MKKTMQLVSALIIGMWVVTQSGPVFSQSYVGEACWSILTEDEVETNLKLKLGVLEIGGGHLTASGYFFDTDEPEIVINASGNVVITGEQAVIKVDSTFSGEEDTGTIDWIIIVSLSSLNGIWAAYSDYIEHAGENNIVERDSGIIALSSCTV